MARPNIHFGVVYLSIAALVHLKPEYRVLDSSVLTFVGLAILTTGLRIVYNLSLYPQFFTPLIYLPTPSKRTWLRGNTNSIFLETPLTEMAEWLKSIPNKGMIRYYMVGNLERVLLTTPKALSEVLVHKAYDFCKPELVQLQLRRVTGNGLVLAEGDEHKQQRKNLMPAFSYRHIKDLYPIFWAKSAELVSLIEQDLKARKDPKDNVIQISTWASRATLDIVGLAGMDHDFQSLQDPDNELNKTYRRFFNDDPNITRIILLLGLFLVDLKLLQKLPVRRNKTAQESSETIRSVARQIIREKKEKVNGKENKGVDIISVALQSGTFTEENLVDQMMTFLTAGHETTSTALQWAIYALCKHPDVQTRLREEIRTNLPSLFSSTPLSATTLDALPYLTAVCNEVLRFHPSVPATVRIATRDTTIAGLPVPHNTFFMIPPHIINRSEVFWGSDADTFNPDRWLDQSDSGTIHANKTGGASNNYAMLTFLQGPRSCIGQGFAKAELACLVAVMVGKFSMELRDPHKELEVRKGPTVYPKDGVLARLVPLEGW